MTTRPETDPVLRSFIQRTSVVILLVVLVLGMWYLRGALMTIFFTAIISVALSGPVQALKQRGWSHKTAVLATLGSVFLIIFLLSLIILPVFASQISDLVDQLPEAWEDAQDRYTELAEDTSFLPEIEAGQLGDQDIAEVLIERLGSASRSVLPFLSGVGGIFTDLLIIIVLSIYLLTEPDSYVEGILTLVPRDYRPRAYQIMQSLAHAIRLSVGSQLLAMFIVGTLTYIGLYIIGVENALALAVISGLLNFIPTFGALIALLIGVIFTLATNSDKILPVVIWYLILQQMESNVITPRIVKNTLNLPGAIIIITQIIAGTLFGFLGVMLSVPLVAVFMVLIRELYVYDFLNSRRAQISRVHTDDGREVAMISADPYRPEELSPGETAQLLEAGADPFEHVRQQQTIEIIGPSVEHIEKVSENQRAVWVAILALVAAQGVALIRSLLVEEKHKA